MAEHRPHRQGAPRAARSARRGTLTASTGAQDLHTLPDAVRDALDTVTRSQPRKTHHRPRQAAMVQRIPIE